MTIFYSNSIVNKVLVDLKYELIQKKINSWELLQDSRYITLDK